MQFGLRYGIANAQGQVSPGDAALILQDAWAAGVRTLDTAVAYGDSESVLGTLGVGNWALITKIPQRPPMAGEVDAWVRAKTTESLDTLRIDRLHGLLLHRPAELLGGDGDALYRALLTERDEGRALKIGISIYSPEELEALPQHMTFDIVQAPFNVLDSRMLRSGWAARLQDAGCELHARSIFLQGLLLMPASARPAWFAKWDVLFAAWDRWLIESRLSPLEACLQYALRAQGIDRVVVGIDNRQQLRELVAAASSSCTHPSLPDDLLTDDPALLNPALWNTK